jgi:hypothetical protein
MFERVAPAQPTPAITPPPTPATTPHGTTRNVIDPYTTTLIDPASRKATTMGQGMSMRRRAYYGDYGYGLGSGSLSIGGRSINERYASNFTIVSGGKFGLRLLNDMPLYGVVEIDVIAHEFSNSDFNQNSFGYFSFINGLGAIFYPISRVQLAVSIGFNYTESGNVQLNGYTTTKFDGGGIGFAWNTSAGYELLGKRAH